MQLLIAIRASHLLSVLGEHGYGQQRILGYQCSRFMLLSGYADRNNEAKTWKWKSYFPQNPVCSFSSPGILPDHGSISDSYSSLVLWDFILDRSCYSALVMVEEEEYTKCSERRRKALLAFPFGAAMYGITASCGLCLMERSHARYSDLRNNLYQWYWDSKPCYDDKDARTFARIPIWTLECYFLVSYHYSVALCTNL